PRPTGRGTGRGFALGYARAGHAEPGGRRAAPTHGASGPGRRAVAVLEAARRGGRPRPGRGRGARPARRRVPGDGRTPFRQAATGPTGRAGDEARAGGELLRVGGGFLRSGPVEAGRLRGSDPGLVGGAPGRPLVRGADGAVGAGGGAGPVRR